MRHEVAHREECGRRFIGEPRGLAKYYGTDAQPKIKLFRRLLADAQRLGIRPDGRLFSACCRDVRSTFLRLATLRNAAATRAAFVLLSAHVQAFFGPMLPDDSRERPLARALLRGDYAAFLLHRRLG